MADANAPAKPQFEPMTTPLARLSFPSLDKATKMAGSQGQETFHATLLFSPADFSPADVERWKRIKLAIAQCMHGKFGAAAFDPQTKRLNTGFRSPIRLGTEKPGTPGYGAGVEFFKAGSQYKPGLTNPLKIAIPVSELYAGCFVRGTVSPWAYSNSGNKGVSLNLHNVMKIADGEAFGNAGVSIESDFGDLTADEMRFDDPMGQIMPGDGAPDDFQL